MESDPFSTSSIVQLIGSASSDSAAVLKLEALIPGLREALASSKAEGEICGRVFKRGDIAFNCRTCQSDPNCVQCETCFRASNHEGHDILFHRAGPGGCCDCGDTEAWKIEGCVS